MNCVNCDKSTVNPKFCSRSCSATYNNKKNPKRKLVKTCALCPVKIKHYRKFCEDCLNICPIHLIKRKMYKNGKRLCKPCHSAHQVRYRRDKIIRLKLDAGGKCQICDYSRCLQALHFHHINPNEKSFGLGSGANHSREKMYKEAAKCLLVCGNCHTEIHYDITMVTGIEPAISNLTG